MHPEEVEVVIFHHPCTDGAAAAWVAKQFNQKIWLMEWTHEKIDENRMLEIIENCKDKNVMFVDCAPKTRDQLYQLSYSCKQYLILDHHKSGMELFADGFNPSNGEVRFDMEKSGCVLAWEFFFPLKPIPTLLLYIQERDLWKFKLEGSKEFTDYFYAMHNPSNVLEFFRIMNDYTQNEEAFATIMKRGLAVSEFKQQMCQDMASRSLSKMYKDYKIKVTPCDFLLISDVGNYMCQDDDVDFAVLYQVKEGSSGLMAMLSFRSKKTDVSAIAKEFPGGGGHAASAGCTIPLDQFLELFLNHKPKKRDLTLREKNEIVTKKIRFTHPGLCDCEHKTEEEIVISQVEVIHPWLNLEYHEACGKIFDLHGEQMGNVEKTAKSL